MCVCAWNVLILTKRYDYLTIQQRKQIRSLLLWEICTKQYVCEYSEFPDLNCINNNCSICKDKLEKKYEAMLQETGSTIVKYMQWERTSQHQVWWFKGWQSCKEGVATSGSLKHPCCSVWQYLQWNARIQRSCIQERLPIQWTQEIGRKPSRRPCHRLRRLLAKLRNGSKWWNPNCPWHQKASYTAHNVSCSPRQR